MPTIIKADAANGFVTIADGSGILELQGTAGVVTAGNNIGAFIIPAGTTAQRPASPTNGMIRYNTTTSSVEVYKAGTWGSVGGGATGGGQNAAFYLNDTTISVNYTVPTGQNAMTAGPVTINDGVTVTVSDGSAWTIV
jgi:hypothetical protein